MLMIWNYFGDVCSLCWRRRSCVLVWWCWMFLTLIWVHMWGFRRRAIFRNCIFSFKLFIFIIFIDLIFFNSMIANPVGYSCLSFFFSVFSCGLIIVSLRLCNSLSLTLVHSWTFWNNTFPVFINLRVSYIRNLDRWLFFICSIIICLSFVLLSKIRSNADRFIIRLSCFLASCVLLLNRWLLSLPTSLLNICLWQRTWLISICCILSFVNLAWLLVLSLDLWKHVSSIMSLPSTIFFFQSLFHLLWTLIARFGQSIS